MSRIAFRRLDLIRGRRLWTPAQISTYAWYDASDVRTLTHSGGAVSQWNDKSANALHLTQATGGKQPITGTRHINSLNAIDFDGTNDLILRASGMPDGDVTVFGVIIADAIGGRVWFGNGGSGGAKSRTYVQDNNIDFGNAALAYSPSLSAGTPYIIMAQIDDVGDSSTQGYRINGGGLSTGGTQRGVPQASMSIGANAGEVTFFDGIVGEVIVITALLSDADRQRGEGYLAWKWGLVHNLPSDHPFKYAPPKI